MQHCRISLVMAAALLTAGCESDISTRVTNTNTATSDDHSVTTAPVTTTTRNTTTAPRPITTPTVTPDGEWIIVLDDVLTNGRSVGDVDGGEFTDGGYELLTPTGAFLQYDTPCQQAIRVEFDAVGFAESTNAEKLVLLQVYDLPHDAAIWVGGSDAWAEGSLIELKQRDGDLRWRIGGRGGDENYPTEYIEGVGWQPDMVYHVVVEWRGGLLTVWRNGEELLAIPSETFAPRDVLHVRIGGSPFDNGLQHVIISNVTIWGIAAP